MTTATEQLHEVIAAYNEAWNAHDVQRIRSLHAPDMVFENVPKDWPLTLLSPGWVMITFVPVFPPIQIVS